MLPLASVFLVAATATPSGHADRTVVGPSVQQPVHDRRAALAAVAGAGGEGCGAGGAALTIARNRSMISVAGSVLPGAVCASGGRGLLSDKGGWRRWARPGGASGGYGDVPWCGGTCADRCRSWVAL